MTRTIKLNATSQNIKIIQKTPTVKLTSVSPRIVLKQVGIRGQTGPGLVFRGAWETGLLYAHYDVVTNDGKTYVSIADHTSSSTTTPESGINWTTYWTVIAKDGGTGETGAIGPQGVPGTAAEGSDKTFTLQFTVQSVVEVNHNLGKYPAVIVIDSAGDEVVGEVYYINTTQLVVTFANPFSGQITCN